MEANFQVIEPGNQHSGKYGPEDFLPGSLVRIFLPNGWIRIREGIVLNTAKSKRKAFGRSPAIQIEVLKSGNLYPNEPRSRCVRNWNGRWVWGEPSLKEITPYRRSYFYKNISLVELITSVNTE